MYTVVWRFQAKPGREGDFEQAYGPNGDWVTLFRTDPQFIGTELLRDLDRPGYYISVDRWDSREAYEAFKAREREAYDAIDGRCAELTILEKDVGHYAGG